MEKTCLNCKHYIPILTSISSDYHIHDWCKIWKAHIPVDYLQNKKCDELCPALTSTSVDCTQCENRFDDVEASKAVCWCFEEIGEKTNE